MNLKTINETQYTVIVYSGRCQWDKPIEDLENAFQTEKEAKEYIYNVESYDPRYFCEIVKA